jgi:sugar lactone lactonase YvrE
MGRSISCRGAEFGIAELFELYSNPEVVCATLTFTGPRRRMLYITGSKSIFKIPLAVSGYSLYPLLER